MTKVTWCSDAALPISRVRELLPASGVIYPLQRAYSLCTNDREPNSTPATSSKGDSAPKPSLLSSGKSGSYGIGMFEKVFKNANTCRIHQFILRQGQSDLFY